MRLVDTDVLVDVIRGTEPAVEWVQAAHVESLAISGYTVMELLDGCANKLEVRRVRALVDPYRIVWLAEQHSEQAMDNFPQATLAHGIGVIDMLIAQCAIALDVPLLTFNTRHYRAVPGLTIEQPYERPPPRPPRPQRWWRRLFR